MYNSRGFVANHEFYCTQCGEKGIPVSRSKGRCKENGHLKILYCLNCKKRTNHAECVPYSKYDADIFRQEYLSGNFDKDGKRILSLSEWKQKINKVG